MGDIIHRLNWDKQQNGLASLLPYEHFDLIGGSGTGGYACLINIVNSSLNSQQTDCHHVRKATHDCRGSIRRILYDN